MSEPGGPHDARGSVHIGEAGPDDGPAISTLLTSVDLPPPEDLAEDARFWLARDGDRIVGCAGLEIFDNVGLVRSVAVSASDHGRRIGTRLLREVVAHATDRHLGELLLLTLSASTFFARHGFEAVDRATVRGPVAQSWEFRHHGCDDAECMRRSLVP